jgi:hypothetical protein
MEPQERTLTVVHYAEVGGKQVKKRVTLAVQMIQFIIAGDETYEMIEDREIRQVNVIFMDGNNLELFISVLDLSTIERAVGSYFLP